MMQFFKTMLAQRTTQFYFFAVLSIFVPLLALVILGLVHLWANDGFLWFGLGVLGLACVTAALRYLLWRETDGVDGAIDREANGEESRVIHLEATPDWSDHDTQVWDASLENIALQKLSTLAWEQVPDAMLSQLKFVARTYNDDDPRAEYGFTIPALMLMLEVCSREYRALVIQNIPFSQDMKLSTAISWSRKSTATYELYKKYSPVLDVLRAVLSGGSSIPGRIAGGLLSDVGGGLTDHMQRNLKQMLFEQVSQVAIDLYSGRLKLSESELKAYRVTVNEPEEAVIRPLSILVLGQVNAGKSSLVNALKQDSVAGVDVLPATDGFHRYRFALSEEVDIDLTDTPGLDGSDRTSGDLLEHAVKADLLLWLSQANQPAKALDIALLKEWDEYFANNLGRKKPPVLLITTHNDVLKPKQEWNPPYNLSDTENIKVKTIVAAAAYTRKSLGFSDDATVIPVALKPGAEPYNIDSLCEVLTALCSEARAAQLNRERLEAADTAPVIRRALSQGAGLAGSALKLVLR